MCTKIIFECAESFFREQKESQSVQEEFLSIRKKSHSKANRLSERIRGLLEHSEILAFFEVTSCHDKPAMKSS